MSLRQSVVVLLVLPSAMFVVLAAPACRRQGSAPAPERSREGDSGRPPKLIEPGTVGTSEAITKGIRRQMRGTRTQCEEGPPSSESRAEWKRFSKPRDLESMPVAALATQDDHALVSEMHARLLDQIYTVGLERMTRQEQNVYLILALQGEVMNGGFHQFFANSSGNCALRTEAALKEAPGFAAWAAVLRSALDKFPAGRPSEDRALRGEQMEAMGDEFGVWSASDDAYFKLRDSDPPLAQYIRGRVGSFAKVVPRP